MAVAYFNKRLRQKNAAGDYDIFHVETESSQVLRSTSTAGTYNGTVEEALAALEARNVVLLGGDVTGTGVYDSDNNRITINAAVVDDSHNHTGSTVTVANSTSGNFLSTDANHHPVDSGKKAADFANASHAHGDITNDGKITADSVAIASGDSLIIADSSGSGKLAKTSIAFDGSTATKALTLRGTWETFNNYTHPTYDAITEGFRKVGRDASGHVVSTAAVAASDVKGLSDIDMTGATSAAAGTHGMVPAPAAGDEAKVLSGSGTWVNVLSDLTTYAASDSVAGPANSTKAALTFGSKTFNGSAAQTITAADLGLAAALKFIGVTTTALTDGATTNPITIGGKSVTATTGDVVIYDNKEFVWDGAKWCKLGDDTSWALKDHTHGNITNTGAITATAVTAASGDSIIVADSSDSGKLAKSIAIGADTTKFLRNDGTWVVPAGTYVHPTDKTAHTEGFYKIANDTAGHVTSATAVTASDVKGLVGINMTAASATAAGIHGMVPAPAAGDQDKILSGAGTWVARYVHPTYAEAAAAAKKVGRDATGHVVLGDALTYSDVGAAASSHAHGNITSGGAITADGVAIASGDAIAIVDSSASGVLAKTSITFDGSTATQALTKKGTWETFNNYVHPTYTAAAAAAKKVGCDATGHVVLGDALTFSDISGTLTVAKGGTGATTAAGARANLGVVNVQSGATQPSDQAAGDIWYETV